MYIMFDMVDTAFSYGRTLIVYYFLRESFKVNGSSLHGICNADTTFLLGQHYDMMNACVKDATEDQ